MTRLIRAGLRSVPSLICGYVSLLVTSHFRIGLNVWVQLTWRHNTFLVHLSLGNKLVVYIVLNAWYGILLHSERTLQCCFLVDRTGQKVVIKNK